MSFRVKICGVTTAADALMAAEAGADAIGLNFYQGSKRFIETGRARQITSELPNDVVKVGVFVNASREEIERTADAVGLDVVQLHGDEQPELLQHLNSRPVMKAFRLRQPNLAEVVEYLERCRELGRSPDLVLIDAYAPDQYGGTGAAVDWATLAEQHYRVGTIPLVLAGGLTPDNVAEAVKLGRPAAVDTASGVEQRPGQKDAELVLRFVQQARQALLDVAPQSRDHSTRRPRLASSGPGRIS